MRVPKFVRNWRRDLPGRPLPPSFWAVREGETQVLLYITPSAATAREGAPPGATLVEVSYPGLRIKSVARIGEGGSSIAHDRLARRKYLQQEGAL